MSNDAQRLVWIMLMPFLALVIEFVDVLAPAVELLAVTFVEFGVALGAPVRFLLVGIDATLGALGTVAPIVLLVVAAASIRETIVAAAGAGPRSPGVVSFLSRVLGSSSPVESGSWQERTIEDAVDDVTAQYVAGEIDELELERKVERALDPGYHELIERLKEVGGIDDELAEPVAIRFGSVEALRAASDAELRGVNGIGEQRADAIRDEIGRTSATSSTSTGTGSTAVRAEQ